MAKKDIRGILFDIDGTLIDSNDAHARAWLQALAEQNFEFSYDRVYHLIGKGGDKVIPELTGQSADSSLGKQLSAKHTQIFNNFYLPLLRPTAGAHDLLKFLRDKGFRLVVATSANPQELQKLLKVAKITEYFDEETSKGDAEASKPSPDIIQAALDKAGLAADEVIMVGDTPYDIEAAKNAGVDTIALRSGGWQDHDLKGAVAIYDSPADLLNNYVRSPLAMSK